MHWDDYHLQLRKFNLKSHPEARAHFMEMLPQDELASGLKALIAVKACQIFLNHTDLAVFPADHLSKFRILIAHHPSRYERRFFITYNLEIIGEIIDLLDVDMLTRTIMFQLHKNKPLEGF